MQITINTDTLAATLSGTPIPKAGGLCPLELYFQDATGAPVSLADGFLIEYGMRLAAAPSSGILAYTDEFSGAAGNSYAGFVDLNDTRLMGAIAGNVQISIKAEVAWTVNGQRFVSSDIPYFVQPPIIGPGASTSGGPSYPTTTQLNAAIAAAIDALAWSEPYLALSAAGTTILEADGPWLNGRFPLTIEAGSGAFVANITLSPTNAMAGALLRIPIDFAASVNGTVNIYDGSVEGTLIQTITNIDANVRSILFLGGFDGAHWKKETADWVE
jgi:hypothetical protein